jgi:hypothetical protein
MHDFEEVEIPNGITEQMTAIPAAKITFESAVGRAAPAVGFQNIRYLAHLGDDLPAFRIGWNAAHAVGVQSEEPRMRLIVRAERVVADAIRAHPARNEAGHVGDGGALDEALCQPPCVRLVHLIAAASGAFASPGEIEAGKHRTVLDRAPPTDGVWLS